ncbi:MAG: hypothetical protein SVU32_09400 [Candidatus Nanohaloarchaea archaeon]|nr:hypothetical protein [Candidatus Nanohaloarchaea archaeon]
MTATGIDLSDINLVYDHDKNVHRNDIGQDYLIDLLDGIDTEESFREAVYAYRDGDKDPNGAYLSDETYSEGEELGIMIAEQGIAKDKILDQVDGNGFRDGFPTFLQDSIDAGATSYIVSAGDEDFLQAFYREHGFNPDHESLHINGTKQQWEDGKAAGIINGCGREKKPERYFTNAAATYITRERDGNHPMDPLVVSGDSSGDSHLMHYARKNGGLAIATGEDAADHADIVVQADSWYGQIAATLGYAGLHNGMTRDEIIQEGRDYLQQYDIEDDIHIQPAAHGDRTISLNGKHHDISIGETVADLAEAMLE